MYLKILCTGGTFDKVYFDRASEYQIGEPQAGELLRRLGASFDYGVVSVMKKDSLDLTDADRARIRALIEADPGQRHYLVIHGTDTMIETAHALAKLPGRVIVLTGALAPALHRDSDAEFNLGCAVGAVQSLPDGVYIVMNGRVWHPWRVRKNRAANRFEPLD